MTEKLPPPIAADVDLRDLKYMPMFGMFINVEAMGRVNDETRGESMRIAIDMILELWQPGKVPIVADAERIVERLNQRRKTKMTVEMFEEQRPDILKYFTVLEDGRLVPNPDIFSLNDDFGA